VSALENKRKPRGKPFEKGNKFGPRFKPGESGNPGGRPASDISPSRILEELARIAFLDPRKLFDADGNLIPIDKLDEDTAHALAGIDHDAIFSGRGDERERIGTTTKLKIIHKTQALELLGKFHRMFIDRVEQSGLDGGPIEHTIRFGDGKKPDES
jgi:hypothetical protein